MLRPEEVESLVCGLPTLDLTELQKVVTYDGYTKDDSIIKYVHYSTAIDRVMNVLKLCGWFILTITCGYF